MRISQEQRLVDKGYTYDAGKHYWYRFRTECCNAPGKQKMLYKGTVVTDPDFKIIATDKQGKTKSKPVTFRWYCGTCDEPAELIQEMVFERRKV